MLDIMATMADRMDGNCPEELTFARGLEWLIKRAPGYRLICGQVAFNILTRLFYHPALIRILPTNPQNQHLFTGPMHITSPIFCQHRLISQCQNTITKLPNLFSLHPSSWPPRPQVPNPSTPTSTSNTSWAQEHYAKSMNIAMSSIDPVQSLTIYQKLSSTLHPSCS